MDGARLVLVGLYLSFTTATASCSCSELTGEGRTDGEADSLPDYLWDHWADSAYDTWFADNPPEVSGDAPIDPDDENPFGCPPPLDVLSEFVVDGDSSPSSPVDLYHLCAVSDIRYHSIVDGLTLSLECEDELSHTLDLIPHPPLIVALSIGDEVMLYYRAAPTPEDSDLYERWLRIESLAGELIFVAVDATSLYPEEGVDFFFPMSCFVGGDCDHHVSSCYDEERSMIVISDLRSGMSVEVWDGREGWVGVGTLYHIRVGEAKRRESIRCPGVNENWYRLLLSLD